MPGQALQEHSTCSPEGNMLWSKGADGSDHYSVCYAPALVGGGFGPSGGHLQCDAGSYFFTESPKFCCNSPRMDMNGTTVSSKKKQLCGDTLAKFNEDSQEIQFLRGPLANAKQEDLDDLAESGRGDMVPTAVGFRAVKKDEDWDRVSRAVCRGDRGTLITWVNTGKDDVQKAELCPTGTVPVQGRGYMSFQCDGYVIKERRYHCCRVNGILHCNTTLVDTTAMEPPCSCHQNDVAPAPVVQERVAAPCRHPLCNHCFRRLRRPFCPYCRADLTRREVTGLALAAKPREVSNQDLALLRRCETLEELHEAVLELAAQTAFSARQSLRSAATRQSCWLLGLGFASMARALSAARILTGLLEDGLLEASSTLQTALLDALLALCAPQVLRSGRARPSTARAAGSARVRPRSAACGAIAAPRSPDLKDWLQKVALVVSFAGCLDESSLEPLLMAELRRVLEAATESELLSLQKELGQSGLGAFQQPALEVLSEFLSRQETLKAGPPKAAAPSPKRSAKARARPQTAGPAVKRGLRESWEGPVPGNFKILSV
ncbi:unnamed protein product [Effrenium voratum]|nr:unnamed protein product [Effrenium voratum]